MTLLVVIMMLLTPGHHGEQLSRAEIRDLVAEHRDWPVERMTSVAICESRGFVSAVSRTHDIGLLQINAVHWKGLIDAYRIMTDPAYAVLRAHEIWELQGIRAWACAS